VLFRKSVDYQLFSLEMATFLRAGLSISDALLMLSERMRASLERTFAAKLLESIQEGKGLSASLESATDGKADVLIALVRSSEQTGQVPEAFERYSAYQQRLASASKKIITALLYPVILIVVGTAIASFLLFYIVPKLSAVYGDLNQELPWASAQLIAWGQWVSLHPTFVRVFFALIVLFFLGFAFSSRFRGQLVHTVLSMHWIKGFRLQFILGRFYYTVSILLGSGLPMLRALELAGDVLGDSLKSQHLALVGSIKSGLTLSEALDSSGLLTSVGRRLIQSGEKSGAVGEMLSHTAKIHEDDTWQILERFARTFEPLCMIILGLLIGGLVILMYLPIFDLTQMVR
jgi:general secretion pathway protein F